MPTVELSLEESSVLSEVLQTKLRDLTLEIANTDHAEFRAELRGRAACLQRLLDRIEVVSKERLGRILL